MDIKVIKLWFNSLTAFICEVHLNIETGRVFYKTNFNDKLSAFHETHIHGKLPNYESFFLVDLERAKHFGKYAFNTMSWNSYYGTERGICIDGVYWNLYLELENGSIREIVGENEMPDDFEEFVIRKAEKFNNRYVFCFNL